MHTNMLHYQIIRLNDITIALNHFELGGWEILPYKIASDGTDSFRITLPAICDQF